jgi:hypothetical protein
LHVRRVKNGTPSVHPIRGDEMRAIISASCWRSSAVPSRPPTAVSCREHRLHCASNVGLAAACQVAPTLLMADSAKLSIEAVKPEKLRVGG